ncbi:MAG: hypothetical protein A2622_12970 [Bdellovibrionales bacterium RIFCSPHIGHO2_01_FULL_40_29]|nr:MAG: hypothetical protein A2622_12970 [Bdellovibrionales bacterium RIFCSPHIGHO2_01_FULL_40_29]OFZ33395.1 MAG: hypothetical protein A3D17_13915 [Bdellovibrionales bacterium RIFCSPHIGHO2_02_FULL_40_15]
MNAESKLTASTAFDAGSDLWVLPSTQNKWWQDIDFRTGFLLSHSLLFQKTTTSTALETILAETQIQKQNFLTSQKSLLIGTEGHLLNKWILLVPEDSKQAVNEVVETCATLKIHSLRFFGFPKDQIDHITAQLSTSLNRISFID